MRASEVLRAARERVVAHGWVQYQYGSESCGYCALGAIRGAPAQDLMAATVVMRRIVGGPVVDWNDDPYRTYADVLTAFEQAEALALAEEAAVTP